MFSCDREDIECREVSGLAPRFHVEFGPDAPDEFRGAAFGRKHAGKKKQIAGLDRFHIGPERFRRFR